MPVSRTTVLGLVAVVSVALLLRWPIAPIPLERDEGEYAYIAQRWLAGEPPYRSAFDQKPPCVFAAYAVILTLFGTNPAAIHWGAQVYTLGTLGLIYLAGRRLFGPSAGLAAALLAAYMTADRCVLGNAANTELFMILPLTAGFFAAVLATDTASAGWASLSGACGALAVLFKQVALPDVVLYGLLLLGAPRKRWQLVAVFTLAAVALLSSVAVYFAAVGALDEFLDCVLLHNLDYASQVPWYMYPGTFLWKFRFAALQWWPIIGLAIAGFLRPVTTFTRWEPRWLAAVWLLASFAGVAVGGYFREHYFIQLVPPLAVLAGRGAVIVRDRWFPPLPAVAIAVAAIAYGILVMPEYWLTGTPAEKSWALYDIAPFPEAVSIGAYLDRHAGPDDTVFVYGNEPEIYYYSRRRSASRYIFLYPLLTPAPGVADRQQAALDELAIRRPRFIVVHRDIFPTYFGAKPPPLHLSVELQKLLARDYKLVGIIGPTDSAVRPFEGTVPDGTELNPPVDHTLAVWRRRES